ncbi:MAG: Uma2 family endonuclease [Cyanobacteria bacterium J069]|nr:MAG: Uma2 family endonuclease [Cyanobacteria bacterium J069]
MTSQQPFIEQVDSRRFPKETLPTMYDLPSEDPEEPGLPDEFHDLQPQLLSATLRLTHHARDQAFNGTDLNLYYDVQHPLWHKRPDWFLVLGVPRLYGGVDLRSSYVLWQEGVNPLVVVELLSPGTEAEDLGPYAESDSAAPAPAADMPPRKWEVYERILQVPYYIVFSRYTNQLRVFQHDGDRYIEQPVGETNPRAWIPELELGLGIWQGTYDGLSRNWLRWCDAAGTWIPTPAERAEQLQARTEQLENRAEQLENRAEQLENRAERLAERLRLLGVDPDEI